QFLRAMWDKEQSTKEPNPGVPQPGACFVQATDSGNNESGSVHLATSSDYDEILSLLGSALKNWP
ncbi:MAG: hypothetical protein ACE5HM_08175, partial [Acidiferrobacterales bacterium]